MAQLSSKSRFMAAVWKKTLRKARRWKKMRHSQNKLWRQVCLTIPRAPPLVSSVRPGPEPNSSPHSRPSPAVRRPISADLRCISSMTMMTHELNVLPCCLITSLDASSFSFLYPSVLSTLSSMSLPPG
ncbi:Chalcone synthase 4 [Dichanthelium oligosanthes]|uniref:Chalcone synthase 4 n=1 Tax=Dichanthelium oligosanthes TaxID=888268 RepID=A0A1E5VQB5_9POAL|nr:Chalcone synthase 4 [Dichanthelium oligosanthes]